MQGKQELHNKDIEKGIIANLVLRNENYDDVADKLFINDFFDIRHQTLIEAIIALSEQGRNYDVFILSDYLVEKDILEKAGGEKYLIDIIGNSPSIVNLAGYLEILSKKAIKRKLSNVLLEGSQLIHQASDDIENDVLAKVEENILSIRNNLDRDADEFLRPENILPGLLSNLERVSQEDGVQGLSSGFKSLDKKLGGLREEQLIVVAGRPAMGKTTFAMNIAENILKNTDKSVLFFSMEMSARDIMERMISSHGLLDFSKVRQADFSLYRDVLIFNF